MTLERLEKYADLRKEAQLLENRLIDLERQAHAVVSDVVTASMRDFPYTQYHAVVKGYSKKRADHLKRMTVSYTRRSASLHSELEEIEKWLEGVQDSKVRQIVELKYILGRSWNATARKVYGKPCGDAARKYLKRFFEKNF